MRIGSYVDGRTLDWDGESNTLAIGGYAVTPHAVVAYDQADQIEWSNLEWRAWAYAYAGLEAPVETVAGGFEVSPESTRVLLRRLGAFVLDYIVITVVTLPIFFLIREFSDSIQSYNAVAYPLNVALIAGYHVISEAAFGWTPGKLPFGLRVVRRDGGSISLLQAFKRWVGMLVDLLFFGLPGILAIQGTALHQRIGDQWAKTYVVRRASASGV